MSYGSLYPALKRLQREGAVEMVFPKDQAGRRKNVYRITEKGEQLFSELLERAGADASGDSDFSVRLAFFKYLKPETRVRLLERNQIGRMLANDGERAVTSIRPSIEAVVRLVVADVERHRPQPHATRSLDG